MPILGMDFYLVAFIKELKKFRKNLKILNWSQKGVIWVEICNIDLSSIGRDCGVFQSA